MADIVAVLIGGIAGATVAGLIGRSTKISEFRQAWINELRNDIANYLSKAEELMSSWERTNDRSDEEKPKLVADHDKLRSETLIILRRIQMRLNPKDENPHKKEDDQFLQSISDLINIGKLDPRNWRVDWDNHAADAVNQARYLLKREWEVTKQWAFINFCQKYCARAHHFITSNRQKFSH